MQLNTEQNIHHPPTPTAPPTDWKPRFQKVTRSPLEEMCARIQKHGRMELIPDSLAALMMQKQKWETVEPNGISFIINGETHRFFHPESQVCVTAVGQRVLFSYDPDDLSVIYILSASGRFQEAVPRDCKVAWFADDMAEQIAKYRRVTQHAHESLERIHGKTTAKIYDRTKANAAAVTALHTLPLPDEVASVDATKDADEAQQDGWQRGGLTARKRGMANADGVVEAQGAINRMRSDKVDRQRELSRVEITEQDRRAAMGDDDSDEEHVFTADDVSAALSTDG